MFNRSTRASSAGGHSHALISGLEKKWNLVTSARLLQLSYTDGRDVGAPMKPSDALCRKLDEGNQKGGDKETAEDRSWRQQRMERRIK